MPLNQGMTSRQRFVLYESPDAARTASGTESAPNASLGIHHHLKVSVATFLPGDGSLGADGNAYAAVPTGSVIKIVPEVNADAIEGYSKKNIIANPNCSTAQMVVALKPLHYRARIKRVIVSTYQSVSGAGGRARGALEEQLRLCLPRLHGSGH